MNKRWGTISFILFCLGLALAAIGGLVSPASVGIGSVLAIIGVIVGVIYAIGAKEINTLLLATIALLATAAAFAPITVLGVGKAVTNIVVYFAALMAPVAVISAIRALLKIGLEK